jgi:hypothetical protein
VNNGSGLLVCGNFKINVFQAVIIVGFLGGEMQHTVIRIIHAGVMVYVRQIDGNPASSLRLLL